MRCRACNNMLSDSEMRRKDPNTKDYTDLCTSCFLWSIGNYIENGGYISDVNTIQLLEEIEVSPEENHGILRGIHYEVADKDNY